MTGFMHGITLEELDVGDRPITTVRSAIIGLVGTAPDASAGEYATMTIGSSLLDNALKLEAKEVGPAPNKYYLDIIKNPIPGGSLVLEANLPKIEVQLAQDDNYQVTSTAAELTKALNDNAETQTLLTATQLGTGAGIVLEAKSLYFKGGKEEPFPLNKPRLIPGSQMVAAKLGGTGTLPAAVKDIFKQAGALIVVVRVQDTDGVTEGIEALSTSQTETNYTPRILIAPGFSEQDAFAIPLEAMAVKLRGMAYIDSPADMAYTDAVKRALFYGERVEITWPNIKSASTPKQSATYMAYSAYSAYSAGLRVRIDTTKGFWFSKSNQTIYGIDGTSQPVEWIMGDKNCIANLLNEGNVSTIIRSGGYRHWGNRTCSKDPRWAFEQTRRTADIINDSILFSHLWAVDKNITKTYFSSVVDSVNAYLRELKALGAIIDGNCWYDPELNSKETIAKGVVYFDFDFSPPYPAEHIVFRSRINNDYLEEVFS